MTPALRTALFSLAALATGCQALRPLTAPPADYAGYRATRVAPSFDLRVAAAARYLAEHPDGVFVDDVDGWFDRAEPAFFAAKRGSVAGLEAYLRTLPQGPHSEEARRRLAQLRGRRADPNAFGDTAASIESRLSRAAGRRAAVNDGMRRWITRFLDPAVFQAPISGAPGDLVVAWSLGLPAPVCSVSEDAPAGARTCTKLVELPYTLPGDAAGEDRQVSLEIAIIEHPDGRPRRVTLGGAGLFARLEEARSAAPVDAGDAEMAMEAIAAAVAQVTELVEARGPLTPGCKRPAESPVVLDLSCNGVRAVVVAGQSGARDTITLEPLP